MECDTAWRVLFFPVRLCELGSVAFELYVFRNLEEMHKLKYKILKKRINLKYKTLKKCIPCDITYLNLGGRRCILKGKHTQDCWNGKKNMQKSMQFCWREPDESENKLLLNILRRRNIGHIF